MRLGGEPEGPALMKHEKGSDRRSGASPNEKGLDRPLAAGCWDGTVGQGARLAGKWQRTLGSGLETSWVWDGVARWRSTVYSVIWSPLHYHNTEHGGGATLTRLQNALPWLPIR